MLLEVLSEEIDICLLYPAEDDINESKVESSEIQEPALPTKNILAENKIDTNVNNGISYKNHIEIIDKQIDSLKVEIIEKKNLFVI